MGSLGKDYLRSLKSIKYAKSCCFFFLAVSLTSLLIFYFNQWTQDLWEEQATAAENLFRGEAFQVKQPMNGRMNMDNATLWEKISRTKEILVCSSRTACSATPFTAQQRITGNDNGNDNHYCPLYFRWIRHDLRPWRRNNGAARESGISLKMVESAQKYANFRITIVGGRMFVQTYRKAFQTRDLFSIWGVAQLLKMYPGAVPDVDFMFNAGDRPVLLHHMVPKENLPPPLFRYCTAPGSFDIPFPDWSFWGWPEVNIPPWRVLKQELDEANRAVKWRDREAKAFWRGNPHVGVFRNGLLQCPRSTPNWQGTLITQNWRHSDPKFLHDSKLPNQCKHRFKIYVEGNAWSVSLKYILACDSTTLLIDTEFVDFFIRGLMPFRDYWPIRTAQMCSDIDFAVSWSNSSSEKAEEIGKMGAEFALKQLDMKYVYDYMLHLLTEYSKLLNYQPTVPSKAVEYCAETISCLATEKEKEYMAASAVKTASLSPPCILPLNDTANEAAIAEFESRKQQAINHVRSLRL